MILLFYQEKTHIKKRAGNYIIPVHLLYFFKDSIIMLLFFYRGKTQEKNTGKKQTCTFNDDR